ncbi:hypothetical protein, partial [Aminobacter sp. MET-1]|uniref:hypothetical protein n=1 Tax=Aminobacter sp. MET-1 TaxID=2951085 RepID=UPI00226AF7B0
LTVIVEAIEDHAGNGRGGWRHAGNLERVSGCLSLASESRQEKDDLHIRTVQLHAICTFIFNFHQSTVRSAKTP